MTGGADLAACRWHDDGSPEALGAIAAFLEDIGVPVRVGDAGASVLVGMTVRCGAIIVDPAQTAWAGDLLHEAGHLALTDPALRPVLEAVSDDPGEEMGAIAWSYAAARHIGIAPEVVFHSAGYRGGSDSMAENFVNGRYLGVPMLALYGMTAEPHRAAERGIPAYPVMQRWLR